MCRKHDITPTLRDLAERRVAHHRARPNKFTHPMALRVSALQADAKLTMEIIDT